ncbi:MAG: hypothetical protein JNN15_07350 [Blastocatellia bacterium]|nr:hypothetical protein [Blastocatellia bacterium]
MVRIITQITTCLLLMLFLITLPCYATGSGDFFPLEEIKPGLKGVGKTIFQGNKTEEFGVEILGVLRGTPSPRRSLIIVKLSGPLAERTGVFAGMSGSPVFIDGKLVGAIAYAFPFSKEPIGAITPIQDTFSVLDSRDAQSEDRDSSSVGISFSQLVAASTSKDLSSALQPSAGVKPVQIGSQAAAIPGLAPYIGQSLIPIATPLVFSGVEQETINYFSGYFQAMGLQPVAAVGGGSSSGPVSSYTPDTLTPGKTIALELVRGDLNLSFIGTVTWRDGEKVYAFGHPAFPPGGMGTGKIPMSEAEVVTVIPSVYNSFKMGTPKTLVGAITQDRSTGIYGKLGETPKMIPLKVAVTNSQGKVQNYKMELISDNNLTPLLMQISTLNAIVATERSFGDLTLDLVGKIKVKGQTDINFSNRFSAANAFISAVIYSGYPMSALYGSGFDFEVEGVDIELKSADRKATGTLIGMSLSKTEVKRGETFTLQAFARNERGEIYTEKVPVTIPNDAPFGKLTLTLGDGGVMAGIDRRAMVDSNPKDLSSLVKAMNRIPKTDRMYVKLYHSDSGLIIKNQELPSLPPSMLAAIDSARSTGGYMPLPTATVLDQELPPAKFLINGQQTITIKVIP